MLVVRAVVAAARRGGFCAQRPEGWVQGLAFGAGLATALVPAAHPAFQRFGGQCIDIMQQPHESRVDRRVCRVAASVATWCAAGAIGSCTPQQLLGSAQLPRLLVNSLLMLLRVQQGFLMPAARLPMDVASRGTGLCHQALLSDSRISGCATRWMSVVYRGGNGFPSSLLRWNAAEFLGQKLLSERAQNLFSCLPLAAQDCSVLPTAG